jgi:AraC-like DNA-binding protein
VIHGRFPDPLTLDGLAREVRMSRSSFAERFTEFVGLPPMTYLARWRIQAASRLLRTSAMSVGEVAAAVGYQSESAFSRVFKQRVGRAPSAWRRQG